MVFIVLLKKSLEDSIASKNLLSIGRAVREIRHALGGTRHFRMGLRQTTQILFGLGEKYLGEISHFLDQNERQSWSKGTFL